MLTETHAGLEPLMPPWHAAVHAPITIKAQSRNDVPEKQLPAVRSAGGPPLKGRMQSNEQQDTLPAGRPLSMPQLSRGTHASIPFKTGARQAQVSHLRVAFWKTHTTQQPHPELCDGPK